jgi:hypothetical protein
MHQQLIMENEARIFNGVLFQWREDLLVKE